MATSKHALPVSEALRRAEQTRDLIRGMYSPAPTYLALVALADEVQRLRGKLAKAQVRR